MFYAIRSFFGFAARSTNEHGVHSPFVFDLVTKCFYDTSAFAEYKTLDKYRKSLLNNHNSITVSDFGSGSRVFKSNERKISDIAKNAGISKKRSQLLLRLTQYFRPKHILEIGTSLGLATSALALADSSAKVISLEGCANTASVANANLKTFGIQNVEVQVAEFDSALGNFSNQVFDLVYFDGNHTKDATLRYFDTLLPTAANDSIWIFDDIHWSREMTEAWNEIKKNPHVTVAIDTFRWGLVFFRKEQQKEAFTIRV